jgi:hypothetical protein
MKELMHNSYRKKASVLCYLLGGIEALGDVAPVDHIPDRLQVVSAHVLVSVTTQGERRKGQRKGNTKKRFDLLEVVGVLPDVEAEERDESSERILVGARGDFNALRILVVAFDENGSSKKSRSEKRKRKRSEAKRSEAR